MTWGSGSPAADARDTNYIPLDEWLDRPRVRMLRAMRFFDWVTAEDLFLALDVAEDKKERDNYSNALRRARQAGDIERHPRRAAYRLVRKITPPSLVDGPLPPPSRPGPGYYLWRGRWRRR